MLQKLLEQQNNASFTVKIDEIREQSNLTNISAAANETPRHATIVYEITGTSAHLEPHLRLSVEHPTDSATTQDAILQALQLHSSALDNNTALLNLLNSSTKYV